MFFKQKSNILFRNYESFGYITDDRNFGYKQTSNNEKYTGDKILSESGSLFMSVLTKTPQNLEVLIDKIMKHLKDVAIDVIKNDALEFYSLLERDGFIVSGETMKECDDKDFRFSYNLLELKTGQKHNTIANTYPEKSTQDFLEEFFNGKPQLTNLHIEITSVCNERCVHCYIPHDYKVSYIKPDLFYNLIKQCKDMRLLHLTISGGEPMLHKNFTDFLRKCKEYDFSINLLSNLTLLNDEIINEMKVNPLLGVQVSLYSMDSNIHDEITQMKGSLEKTKNAILRLVENDIPVQISCPIMKQNKSSYTEVIKWGEKYKIHVGDDYGIIGRYNHTTQNLNCRLSIEEIKDLIINKVANDSKYIEKLESEAEKKKKMTANDFVCSVCNSSICISDNGNAYPCAGWQGYVVGNINETSLNDIWNNSDKVQYLRNLRKKDFPKCIECEDKEFCTMCMVRNANENPQGNPLVVNEFFCNIARLNRKFTLKNK
ncbi:MAG: radical SAM protein [Paludibacter sp.]